MRTLKFCPDCGHLRPAGRNIDRVYRTFGCAICGGMLPSWAVIEIEQAINAVLRNSEAPSIGVPA